MIKTLFLEGSPMSKCGMTSLALWNWLQNIHFAGMRIHSGWQISHKNILQGIVLQFSKADCKYMSAKHSIFMYVSSFCLGMLANYLPKISCLNDTVWRDSDVVPLGGQHTAPRASVQQHHRYSVAGERPCPNLEHNSK